MKGPGGHRFTAARGLDPPALLVVLALARFVGGGLLGVAPFCALGALWPVVQLHLGLGTALATGVALFVWLDVLKAVTAGLAARNLVNPHLGLPAAQRGR